MESSLNMSNQLRTIFLFFGILSAIIYAASDIIFGLIKPGYRFDSQSASALSAFGTPTRLGVVIVNLIASLFLIAFAAGVWMSAGQYGVLLRVMALLIVGNAIFSIIAITFFPVHLDEPMNSPANKLNVILMFTSVVLFIGAICTGIFAYRNWFRFVSLAIILIFVLLTIVGIIVSRNKFVVFGEHGPSVGIQERTMIYSWLLWIALQAIVLLGI